MSFVPPPQATRWIRRSSGERVVQIGFGPLDRIRELTLAELQSVAVTGIGEAQRVLDCHGRVRLEPGEDVVLRHRDDWWFVAADDIRDAFERALTEGRKGRSIIIDEPRHIRARRLPTDAAGRDAALARLRTRRTR